MGAGREQGRVRIALALTVLVLISGAALLGVWGYTSAQVGSEAELNVVESEDALIAVAIKDDLKIEQDADGECGTITNNMASGVELTVSGDECGFEYDPVLQPGGSTALKLVVPSGDGPGLTQYLGMVSARWEGGNAEIEFEVPVEVIEARSVGEQNGAGYQHGKGGSFQGGQPGDPPGAGHGGDNENGGNGNDRSRGNEDEDTPCDTGTGGSLDANATAGHSNPGSETESGRGSDGDSATEGGGEAGNADSRACGTGVSGDSGGSSGDGGGNDTGGDTGSDAAGDDSGE